MNETYESEFIGSFRSLKTSGEPKRGKFGPKRPKMGGTRFFPVLSLGYFINRPKSIFKYAKLRRSYDSFSRNWPKCPFLG